MVDPFVRGVVRLAILSVMLALGGAAIDGLILERGPSSATKFFLLVAIVCTGVLLLSVAI